VRHHKYLRGHLLTYPRQMLILRRGIGLSHAGPGGALVLKGETSWRTVNGVWINTTRFNAWLLFRRVSW
jgi:hypothetical protein